MSGPDDGARRDDARRDDARRDDDAIEGELILPGEAFGSADNETVDGEILDPGVGGAGTAQTREASSEIAGALTLVARGLYRPARLLALIAVPAALLTFATGIFLGSGLGIFSVVVSVIVLAAAAFVTFMSLKAARATADPEALARTVNGALAERRGGDADFDRELAGHVAPLAGGMRIRNVWALTGALAHLPGRWSAYPELRPFLPPVPRLAIIGTVVSVLGMFLCALLFVVNLLALAIS